MCGVEIPASAAYLVPCRGEGEPLALCPACVLEYRFRFADGLQPAEVVVPAGPESPDENEKGAGQPTLRCSNCQRRVPPEQTVLVSGPIVGWPVIVCSSCLAQVKAGLAAETQNIPWAGAVLWGLGTALAAGAVWYLAGRLWLGAAPMLALVAGPAAGIAVYLGAGRKRGRGLQWLALGLATLALLGAEYGLAGAGAMDLFLDSLGQLLRTGYGLGFFILGLWLAWRIPAPRRVLRAYRD
jgi:hypothetical protein